MEQNKSSAEEIDLVYYFKSLKRYTVQYIGVLKRNIRLFLAIFLSVVLIGVAMRFIIPKKYYTEALIISHNIPADFVMISNLQGLASDKNATALSRELGIPYKSAKSVADISAIRMDSVFRFYETDSTGSIIKINMVVKDIDVIQQVQDGIKRYLETNEYSVKKRKTTQRMLESLRDELIIRSRGLDSLAGTASNGIISRSTEKGIVLERAVNPVTINMLQMQYYKELLEVENELDMLKTIEIVQPFLRNDLDSYPVYRVLFVYFALAALLLALLLTPVFGKK